MTATLINQRWSLELPPHRGARPEWETGWETERLASMAANIRTGDLVFDIGTEEGDLSALYALWAGRSPVLVEPNPRVWPNVRWIFEHNDIAPPVAWWVGFASDQTVFFPPQPETRDEPFGKECWPPSAFGSLIGDHGFRQLGERYHDTPQITISDLWRLVGWYPAVITIDVEGSELRVLRGAGHVLDLAKPLVYVSEHPEFMRDGYGTDVSELHSYMAAHGYERTHLATDHEVHAVYSHPDGRALVAP